MCISKFTEWQEVGASADEVPPEIITSAKEILQSLVDRMMKSEPEDFELDKSSDFTQERSVGQKNRAMAGVVMGVYEVSVSQINCTQSK